MIYIYDECESTCYKFHDECETKSSLQCIYVKIMKTYIKICKWNICFKIHSLHQRLNVQMVNNNGYMEKMTWDYEK